MRKINMSWQSVLLSVALLGLAACTGDFEDINRNPNQVTEEQMDALNYKTGTKFKSLQSLVIPVQEHMYQFNESLSGGPFGGYIGATVDTWQTKFETYNPSADWRKWPFANVITETYTPYKGIVNGTEDEVAIAFARLLRVAIMHRVTDSYGPIPYSKLESNESVYVEYDSQEAVYTKMFEELDEAIEILGRNTTLPAEAWSRYDGVYYGNIAQWLKYANSLKLRMAMRLSYVKSDVARAKAAEAIAGGVIEANADNAAMHAAENRTTLIYNDWGDHRVGADILCYMNGYKDPRMEKMFLANDVGDYVGIRIGIDVTSKSQAMSKYSNMIVASDTPYLWFNAAEATFLHAEYELRWGSAETAKTLYEQAVRLSFEERGASGADAYLVDATKKPAPYTDPLGNYSASARKSPFRGKRRRTAAIRRPFRSATSNASSCRNGSLSSRWESKHGRNTAVRGIRNCCLYLPTNREVPSMWNRAHAVCLTLSRSTSRTTPTFRRPFKRSVQSNRTATVRATSWEPAYGGIANRITSNRYEYETKPNDTFPRFLRCRRNVCGLQRLDGDGNGGQQGGKALGAGSGTMGRIHRGAEGL